MGARAPTKGREVMGKHTPERAGGGDHTRGFCAREQSGVVVVNTSCSPCACVYIALLCTLFPSVLRRNVVTPHKVFHGREVTSQYSNRRLKRDKEDEDDVKVKQMKIAGELDRIL